MSDVQSEEKSPLLLYMVETDENMSKNNKRMYFEKTRLQSLTSGATAVFTEFPSYVTTYWISSILSALIFLLMVLLLVMTMSPSRALHRRYIQCTPKENVLFDNNTIHLVHPTSNWDQSHMEILEEIKRNYPEFKTHLILIRDALDIDMNEISATNSVYSDITEISKSTTTVTTLKKMLATTKTKKRNAINNSDDASLSINMGVKRLLDMLLRSRAAPVVSSSVESKEEPESPNRLSTCEPTTQSQASTTEITSTIKTFDDILRDYPNLYLENTTYENAFLNTPLRNSWQYLNDNLRIFALRVVQLWQYGGISFSLEPHPDGLSKDFSIFKRNRINKLEEQINETFEEDKLMNFVRYEKYNIDKLPFGIVTADDEALHIVSKTPCHAFFDEVMKHLKRTQRGVTVKSILQDSLRVFCRHLSVDKRYCDMLMQKHG